MLRWILPALAGGILALAVFFPMRWAAGWILPAEIRTLAPDLKFGGSIWQGTISGLPIFGTANLNIAPLSRQVDFQAGKGRNFTAGRLTPTQVTDLDFRLNLESIPFTDRRLQGLRGELLAEISKAELKDQKCESANGLARTDVLQRNGGTIDWTGPELAGPIRCEAGALIVDLSGQDAQQTITALIRIQPDGSYRANISVRTVRTEADAVLPLFGFSRSGQSFVLTEQGRWR